MKNKAWIHYHIVTETPKDINGKQNVVQQTYLKGFPPAEMSQETAVFLLSSQFAAPPPAPEIPLNNGYPPLQSKNTDKTSQKNLSQSLMEAPPLFHQLLFFSL